MDALKRFFNPPPEAVPLNRRVYALAKMPFAYLWEFVTWAGAPWLWALPFAMTLSAIATLWVGPAMPFWPQAVIDTIEAGLVWTFFLGALFAIVKILRASFE